MSRGDRAPEVDRAHAATALAVEGLGFQQRNEQIKKQLAEHVLSNPHMDNAQHRAKPRVRRTSQLFTVFQSLNGMSAQPLAGHLSGEISHRNATDRRRGSWSKD